MNFKVKTHEATAHRKAVWGFYIVCSSFSPARGYIEIVPYRSKDVLLEVINCVIKPGYTIHSCEWPKYAQLNNHGFTHRTDDQNHYSVDPL